MRFGSVCSGIEAASVAWHPLGWRAAWLSEIEPFPSAVLAHHYPTVPNHGDMTTLPKCILLGEVEAPDILCGGTPCFTAGHLVLTDKGYVPIEQIKPGDMVMTHLGRLQRVVRIGSKSAEVGVLKAVGLLESVRVTADHPFLAVDWRMQNTRRDGRYKRVEYCGKPEWVEARNMPGLQWCALTNYQQIEKSPVSRKFDARQAMYVAGMYLGDGHIRRWSQSDKKALVLNLNPEKLVRLSAVVGEDSYFVSQERTSVRVTICDTALCDWLLEQFGELSHLKRIPAWVLGHEYRAALLQGYLDTDGCKLEAGVSITTTSRALAYGAADLLNAEGYAASVAFNETADTCVIDGRVVNQRDLYQVRAYHRPLSRKSRVRHGYLLRAVQSFEPAGVDTVFNIEVEGDNSYVVNGAVVHNCQAFSVAGLRRSLDDERGNLSLTFCEIADAIDHVRGMRGQPPAIIFWENVPGVLSTADNAFGCFLAGLAGEDGPLQPPGGKWANAGAVYGPSRAVAWRTLDAQYFGLAQRRRRVFVVASAREGFDPAAVLFEFDGVRRDTAPSREAGKVAPTIPARSSGGGGLGTDFDCDGGLIHADPIARCITTGEAKRQDWGTCNFVAHTLRGEGFDASEDGTGRGTPLVPVAFDTVATLDARREAGGFPGTDGACGGHVVAVAFSSKDYGADAGEIAPTLRAMGQTPFAVRRLTCEEAEFLQGFPRGYTKIPWRGKPADECPDGPRYKALGNSWAVPVVAWIGRRISAAIQMRVAA